MHDDKAEKCWIWFWSNGVHFQIFVDREGVRDTSFYEQWKPLLCEREQRLRPLPQWADSQVSWCNVARDGIQDMLLTRNFRCE